MEGFSPRIIRVSHGVEPMLRNAVILVAALLLWPAAALAQGGSQLALSAAYATDGKSIPHGLVWRVFRMGAQGEPELVAQSNLPTPQFAVAPGEYVVHVAYGLAGSTRKVLVGTGTTTERVPLSAGALTVRGSILDQTIPPAGCRSRSIFPSPAHPRVAW